MDSIYDVAWRDYIRDLYSEDTRRLTCYVIAQMDERPWPYWLRRFYWFENSIWALNEIKDLNPASFDTTKMEFIKVQDMDNYKLARIVYNGSNSIEMTDTEIGCSGGSVHGVVRMQSAGGWAADDYIVGTDGEGNRTYLDSAQVMSPYTGHGATATTFTITVPGNTGDTPITWQVRIKDDGDVRYTTTFVQETCNTGSSLYLSPAASTVGARYGSTAITMTAIRVTGITVSADTDWVSITVNGNNITVNYLKNATASARTATITASGTGVEGPVTTTATITQNGLGQITTDKNEVVLEWNQLSGATFNITTDDDWISIINDNTI